MRRHQDSLSDVEYRSDGEFGGSRTPTARTPTPSHAKSDNNFKRMSNPTSQTSAISIGGSGTTVSFDLLLTAIPPNRSGISRCTLSVLRPDADSTIWKTEFSISSFESVSFFVGSESFDTKSQFKVQLKWVTATDSVQKAIMGPMDRLIEARESTEESVGTDMQSHSQF